ncbi:60S acidic ribosomal protein P2 [Strongylocentrotus purpuratus]|uniref:Large ribosomal subunit protein P2 n=1 Tax=Strongylocentrotus purpuratus TaxID=7668 RepID=A0A7M7P932_STRPU|nr:60S acidic ribosomal protein P2-like [Strongylocentrotus purpuratus]XP_791224.1 60S acidic ribosomal protein P2 [Strongylocentrotus purpuratus]|eukprot:XP_791224.1 PREDICTED: 60S acidic ribosomal protein P2 [Strongylocentrotus purpuratus]
MRYVAAYLLLALGGKPNASAADVKKVLQSVGVEIDDEKLGIVIKELEGKKVKDLIEEGKSKLASMPAGGGGAAPAAGGGAAAGGAAEEKVEAKKEESEEESDDDMGFGLFD